MDGSVADTTAGTSGPSRVQQGQPEYTASSYQSVPWEEQDPQLAWLKAMQLLRCLQRIQPGTEAHTLLQEHSQHSAACAIYFSNRVEDAGLPLADTVRLVREVLLRGAAAAPNEAPGDAPMQAPAASVPHREVLQHAAAFALLQERMVRDRQPLSEALVCEAHHTLMAGMLHAGGRAVQAGSYRTTPANAGWHQFPPAACISRSMAQLVDEYNERAGDGTEDPFVMAAWLSHEFVSIHPFEDGNGRMCRLLLSMALLSHGVPFCSALGFSSGHRQAKKQYLQCVRHASCHDGRARRLALVVLCGFRDTAAAFLEAVQAALPEEYPSMRIV